MADDILYVVEHIEAELQRLGRLVATLRRRIEAQAGGDATPAPTTVSGPAPPHPTAPPMSSTRTQTRTSSRRFPAAIEEPQDDETMVRTASGGASYGFVREGTRRRTEEPPAEPLGLRDHGPLDRRTR